MTKQSHRQRKVLKKNNIASLISAEIAHVHVPTADSFAMTRTAMQRKSNTNNTLQKVERALLRKILTFLNYYL